ncbi:ribonucleases P/MRP protein subunit POP1 [Acipenser ruthenus]|uniref:ribonucleases P/MRP protein subunit POP1 n=1 Tax=Acipenser ruthenus TaxID=7906 RepID=UPI00145A3146|nr:ribonucleases P/MRP protein subunit POP1 [Acipenser ruthenus]
MSGAKGKKYAKKMRNQPSSVTFPSTDFGQNSGGSSSQDRTQRGNEGDPQYQWQGGASGGFQQQRGHWSQPPGPSHQGQFRGGFRGQRGRGDWQGGQRGHRTHQGYQRHSQELPKFITASSFAQARAAEVNAMLKAVKNKNANSQVFQALPKHMRRRAMSHNIKRLPRRLQTIAKKEADKTSQQKKEVSKTKSRKARRRHGNLLLEFNRRQRKNLWLETHIWHAKRFHMVKKWGYCLGDKPTAKCYRACYRAMTKHCLLQDLSYQCCLELRGAEDDLLKALARVTSTDMGATFAAVACLSGKRQGSLVLYRADRYPKEPLGQVTFIWKPKKVPSEERQLWIWTHPTSKQDLLSELLSVCQCSEAIEPRAPIPGPATSSWKVEQKAEAELLGRKRKRNDKEGEEAVAVKKIIGDGTRLPNQPVSWRSETTGIVMSDLTMEILRYRLIGPLSHCVLADAFKPASDCKEPDGVTEGPCSWWLKHCKDADNLSIHHRQKDTFQLLKGVGSPAEIPAGTVLGLTVDDPRLNLPNKRSQSMPDPSRVQDLQIRQLTLSGVAAECAWSSIWDQAVRDNVTENKIPEKELNHMKSELLVPGSHLSLGPKDSRIPILLVQQPGKQTGEELSGWGSGWDVLVPKGWGMAFWIPFIYRGARAGGLQEGLKHSQNKGAAHFPHDFPDCPAGMRFAKEQENELADKFKRRPPAKRPNYIKHGSIAPFCCPWQQLAEEWEIIVKDSGDEQPAALKGRERPLSAVQGCEEELLKSAESPSKLRLGLQLEGIEVDAGVSVTESKKACAEGIGGFRVLRSRNVLRQLSVWCRPTSGKGQRGQRLVPSFQQELTPESAVSVSAANPLSLVWARLTLLKKGSPALHAMISIPTAEDFEQLSKDPAYCGPQEPKHRDHFKHKIKQIKKSKKKKQPPAEETSEGYKTSSPDGGVCSDLTLGLWPEPLPSVTSHCSRVTIGFVTQGDFSLAVGCGEALGFVSLTGLLHVLSRQPADRRGLVLMRNAASLQYRFAKLRIEV